MANNLNKASFPSKVGKDKQLLDGLKPVNRAARRAMESGKHKKAKENKA
tara:strand:+ start:367 stop:513 length:147 start_codon:yes stop_codon:yes gene_type:complete